MQGLCFFAANNGYKPRNHAAWRIFLPPFCGHLPRMREEGFGCVARWIWVVYGDGGHKKTAGSPPFFVETAAG